MPASAYKSSSGERTITENDELTLSFFLQISESTMGHLPRLLRKLWEPVNVYAIHIDRKVSPELVRKLKESLYAENPRYIANVHFMPPELITYRGVSMLLNTLNAIEFLLEKGLSWDYFINISGSDYPLISVHMQRQLLKSTGDRSLNYIAFAPQDKWEPNLGGRYQHFYVDKALSFTPGTATEMIKTHHANPIARAGDFVYTNSEAWMILSRDFCAYSTRGTAARKLLVTFSFSIESSEHYFSTLAYNSHYNATIVPSSLRSIQWFHKGKSAGQHPFYVDTTYEKTPPHNFTFLKTAMGSPQFYIRKFKFADSKLMDVIDNNMNTPGKIKSAKQHFKWTVERNQIWKAHQPSKFPFD